MDWGESEEINMEKNKKLVEEVYLKKKRQGGNSSSDYEVTGTEFTFLTYLPYGQSMWNNSFQTLVCREGDIVTQEGMRCAPILPCFSV